jgi:hypothetical protein
MRMHRRSVTRSRWLCLNRGIPFLLPPITREAERRTAHLLDCTCRQAQSGTAPVTGNSRDPHYIRAARLSALHSELPRLSSRPGPGQRFLESPDANDNGLSAHHLSSASAASTSQSGHAPDGHDAQAVREQERRTLVRRTRARSAKSRLCADDVPHERADCK